MKYLTSCILFLVSICCFSQEVSYGDTTKIREIQSKCSKIYDNKDTTLFLLTKSVFFNNTIGGTNIIAYSFKKQINRIVAFTTVPTGLQAVEFYFWDNQIIMIYETMEYFDADSPEGQIKNFKNIPYWESRFYISNDKLVAHKHSGRKGIGFDYKALEEIGNSKKILRFVKGKG
jgi:hypothetical protein